MDEYYRTFLELPPLEREIQDRISHMNDTIIMADLHLVDLLEARDELLAEQRAIAGTTTARLTWNFYLVIGCVVTAVILMLFLVTRTINRSVKTASVVAGAIAKGELNNDIVIRSHDEIGRLLQALDDMQGNLREMIEKERVSASENRRIRDALDNVDANVLILDTEHRIIYMNDAMAEMLLAAQDDIRKDLPEFDIDTLKGKGIEMFFDDPQRCRRELEVLDGSASMEFVTGGHTMDLIANPINTSSGSRLGTVIEWTDRTAQVAVEESIQEIVDGAMEGNLSARIDLDGKTGFLETLSGGFNALVEHLLPGRVSELRPSTRKELNATMLLALLVLLRRRRR